MKMQQPLVGKWYKDVQINALFEVVDWDPGTLTIEIQYLDGEVAEFDLDAWREMMPQRAEAPEDWRAAFELDDEDYAGSGPAIAPRRLDQPAQLHRTRCHVWR